MKECLLLCDNVTKQDYSSADISVPGGMLGVTSDLSSTRHKPLFLRILSEYLDAAPTSKLEPKASRGVESDERDLDMTYEEIHTMVKMLK